MRHQTTVGLAWAKATLILCDRRGYHHIQNSDQPSIILPNALPVTIPLPMNPISMFRPVRLRHELRPMQPFRPLRRQTNSNQDNLSMPHPAPAPFELFPFAVLEISMVSVEMDQVPVLVLREARRTHPFTPAHAGQHVGIIDCPRTTLLDTLFFQLFRDRLEVEAQILGNEFADLGVFLVSAKSWCVVRR